MFTDDYAPWLLLASSLVILHLLGRLVKARDSTKHLQRLVSRAWLNILGCIAGSVLLLLGLLAVVAGSLSLGLGPIIVGVVEIGITIDKRAQIRRAREILAQSHHPG